MFSKQRLVLTPRIKYNIRSQQSLFKTVLLERKCITMNILLITPTSVSVELKNHDCYAAAPFEVRCNGASMGKREHIIQPES